METTGTQSRRDGESYSEYMRRLYYRPVKRGIAAVNAPNKWDEIKDVSWTFRPPVDLTPTAYKYMREKEMSVTTYLTYAMHNLHKQPNA
jgi:hypothetical protein